MRLWATLRLLTKRKKIWEVWPETYVSSPIPLFSFLKWVLSPAGPRLPSPGSPRHAALAGASYLTLGDSLFPPHWCLKREKGYVGDTRDEFLLPWEAHTPCSVQLLLLEPLPSPRTLITLLPSPQEHT